MLTPSRRRRNLQDDIFSSAYASAAYLKYKLNFPADKRVYIIGEAGMEHELDSVGIAHCGGTSPEDNVLPDLMDFSGIDADPSVGCVMVGLDMHFNYKKVARAFRYLRENEGCLFVCTNLDSTFPTHGSVYPGTRPCTTLEQRATLMPHAPRCRRGGCATDVLQRSRAHRRRQARGSHAGEHHGQVSRRRSDRTASRSHGIFPQIQPRQGADAHGRRPA